MKAFFLFAGCLLSLSAISQSSKREVSKENCQLSNTDGAYFREIKQRQHKKDSNKKVPLFLKSQTKNITLETGLQISYQESGDTIR
jgi:hypothetical protein